MAQPIARQPQAGWHGSRCAAIPPAAGQRAQRWRPGVNLSPPLLPNDGQHQWPLQVTNAAALLRRHLRIFDQSLFRRRHSISLLDLTLSCGARPAYYRLSLHHVCPSACTCLCTRCLGAHSSPCTASHAHRSPYLRSNPNLFDKNMCLPVQKGSSTSTCCLPTPPIGLSRLQRAACPDVVKPCMPRVDFRHVSLPAYRLARCQNVLCIFSLPAAGTARHHPTLPHQPSCSSLTTPTAPVS